MLYTQHGSTATEHMTLLCLSEYAQHACSALAGVASLSTLYLYTYYAAQRNLVINPLSWCIPVAAVLMGISMSSYPLLILGYLPLIAALWYLHYNPWYRLLWIHAFFCMLCSASILMLDSFCYHVKQDLLSTGTHALQGLIIDHAPWTDHANGCVITYALTHIDHQPTHGLLKLFLYTPSKVHVGDYVCFFRFTLSVATKQKSFLQAYALREHLIGNFYGPYISTKKLPIDSFLSSWTKWWHGWRKQLYEKLQKTLPQKTFTYFSSLFLGNKQCSDYLVMRLHFTRWGLTHYLARSGLHISILISLWLSALTLLPFGASLKAVILGTILVLYDHLSWCSISFNRALWLWFLYIGSWIIQAQATPFVGLCNALLILLLHNPWYAFCLDFQLSFFLTAVLMLLSYRREQSFLLSSCIAKKK